MKREPRYWLSVSYEGYDNNLDRRLETLLKREIAGAGFDLFNGMRDLSFPFYYQRPAVKALRKLNRIKKRNLKVKLEKCEDE